MIEEPEEEECVYGCMGAVVFIVVSMFVTFVPSI